MQSTDQNETEWIWNRFALCSATACKQTATANTNISVTCTLYQSVAMHTYAVLGLKHPWQSEVCEACPRCHRTSSPNMPRSHAKLQTLFCAFPTTVDRIAWVYWISWSWTSFQRLSEVWTDRAAGPRSSCFFRGNWPISAKPILLLIRNSRQIYFSGMQWH